MSASSLIFGQRIAAMVWLTWKAAVRFRLFLVVTVLLLASVIGLPLLIKDDGTARGFTQILLTYTLTTVSGLLGLSTLWLSCGTLARDIDEQQMQVLAVKPIARWQIWIGKWLGIVTLDAALLAMSGLCICCLLQWRATRLPPEERAVLRNEVLIARASLKEKSLDADIDKDTDQLLAERTQKIKLSDDERFEVRKQLREQVKAQYEAVPAGNYRPWQIDLGLHKNFLHNEPLQLRIKFNSAAKSASGTFPGLVQVGVPQKTKLWSSGPVSLSPDTFHELTIPPDLFDENGILTIAFLNPPENPTLLFPLDDGMEVLYREGGFALNFARGLGIILCWMALLAAIGLASASFLSFPVAAFCSLAILTVAFSGGTLAGVVTDGTVLGGNPDVNKTVGSVVDAVIVPAFRAVLGVVDLAEKFSPIDALSTGRSITWATLGRAFAQIVLLLGGAAAIFGIAVFNRRELATAQSQQ
jgi:hypothetical protein